MRIGEGHALRGQLVEGGRFDFAALRIEALDVAVAEVIGEEVNDVGPDLRGGQEGATQKTQEGDANGAAHGYFFFAFASGAGFSGRVVSTGTSAPNSR